MIYYNTEILAIVSDDGPDQKIFGPSKAKAISTKK